MYNFKYETHLHTSQASDCAQTTGADMADYYKANGYTGIIVTDHFFNGNYARRISADLLWKNRIAMFCEGYEDAKQRGDAIGLDVFFGFEFAFLGTEFLVLGLDKDWLLDNPQIIGMSLRAVLRLFRAAGGFVIHAHPFRDAEYIEMIRLLPDCVDAVEVFNGGNARYLNPRPDKAALQYAALYDLPATGGTDTHSKYQTITGGIALEQRAETIQDLFSAIRERRCEILRGE
jgi:histidinol phosphatase-like PHP family hydrolase